MNPNLSERQFYHGTTMAGLGGMLETGAQPSYSPHTGVGFHMTTEEGEAQKYAARHRDGVVVRGRSQMKNPAGPGQAWNADSKDLRRDGYDGVVNGNLAVAINEGDFVPTHYRGTKERKWTAL